MSSPPAPRPTAPIGSPCLAPGKSAFSLAECVGCRSVVYSSAAAWPAHEAGRSVEERAAGADAEVAPAAAALGAHDTATACAAVGCGARPIARCTRCRRLGYCGHACQVAHWPAHKAQCRAWAAEAGAASVLAVPGDEAAQAAPDATADTAAAAAARRATWTAVWRVPEDGVPSAARARSWQEAAARGDAGAQFNAGMCFYRGWHCGEDEKKAVAWWRKAAAQGLAQAQCNLGDCHEGGSLGVARDAALAVEWHAKAAAQGLAHAQFALGVRYETGKGVAQDAARAVEWYARAAAQGDAKAQYNLGRCHALGIGLAQDAALAVQWYAKAAAQGDAAAQYYLGVCYESGEGVAQDAALAAKWCAKAAVQSFGPAVAAVARRTAASRRAS